MPGSISMAAGGNITPSSFLVLVSGSDRVVNVAGAGNKCVGISREWHRLPPWEGLDDGYIAILNDSVPHYDYGLDQEALLQLGGTVAVGDYLKSDASGHGVTASSDGDEYGAIAIEAGNVGDIVKVQMTRGMRGA